MAGYGATKRGKVPGRKGTEPGARSRRFLSLGNRGRKKKDG